VATPLVSEQGSNCHDHNRSGKDLHTIHRAATSF
jgi:hypothetical protein